MQLGLDTIAPTIAGLEAVIVTVIPDNLLYDSWSKGKRVTAPDESATYFGDLVRVHFDALESVRVERGDIQITIETDGLIILIRNIGANYVISMVFQEQLPLGLMRIHTQRLIQFVDDNLPSWDKEGADEVPFEREDEPEINADPEPEREYHGYVYARDRATKEAAAFELPPEESTDEERPDDKSPAEQAQIDEEAKQYHGYVYARDKERLAAAASDTDALPDPSLDVLGSDDDPNAFVLDISAHESLPSPDTTDGTFELAKIEAEPMLPKTEDPPALTVPTQVAEMINEGGPTLQTEKDHKPAPKLHAEEQALEMIDEGGPVIVSKIQHPPGAVLRTEVQVQQMVDEGGPVIEPVIEHPPGIVLRTNEQIAHMIDEGSPVQQNYDRKHTHYHTAPVDILTAYADEERRHPQVSPPLPSKPQHSGPTAQWRAMRQMEFEGGIVPAAPVDTPTHPVAHPISLADQELQMTHEGGPALPVSATAEQEALVEKLKAAHEATKAAQHRSEDAEPNYDRRDRRYPSMAREAREAGITGFCRAELIIAFVTENTNAPQNVHARLAVHSRVPLDAIRDPESLDAEQVQRLEEAAKSILGVSILEI